jgi:1-acyl-sn-glycerol-3-phosphate acyltransferase
MRKFYATVRRLCQSTLSALYKHETAGIQNLPEGGAVLVANHASYLDSICIGASTPFELHWLADDWLFRVPGLAWILRNLNTLPVGFEHGALSSSALLRTRRVLRHGGKVVIYPEARRSSNGELGLFYEGAARLAMSARVPLVPILISGTWHAWPQARLFPRLKGRTKVVFGEPVDSTEIATATELTATVRSRIAAMMQIHQI